jgi:hypothetical protein
VGPPVVFQFDKYETKHGLAHPSALIKVGATTYYKSQYGFYSTDGVVSVPISEGKISNFVTGLNPGAVAVAGYDDKKKCVLFSEIAAGAVYHYSIDTGRWSRCLDNVEALATEPITGIPYAFNDSHRLCDFNGNQKNVTIRTGEQELFAPNYSFVAGLKPLVEGATAGGMTTSVYYRNDLASAATNTSNTTCTAATGFSDFRLEARYIAAQVFLAGNSGNAIGKIRGVEIKAQPSGER